MDSSRIVAPTAANLDQAARLLQHDELVGIPTETVYGLAAKATSPEAIDKVFAAKNRPATNPLILHVASADHVRRWCTAMMPGWLDDQIEDASRFWPGPLTIVVPRKSNIPGVVTAGSDSVAIRVPDHPVALALLQRCDFPLAAPSANPSNYISPTTASHVASGLGDRVGMILDGGSCKCGVESTIIKLRQRGPLLLRAGGVSVETLQDTFGCHIELSHQPPRSAKCMPSPGQFPKHYSPSKPLLICGVDDPEEPLTKVGRIAFAPPADADASKFGKVWTLSQDGDLNEVARNLFAALREADQSDVACILIDSCVEHGIGKAIMDRINRAAFRE